MPNYHHHFLSLTYDGTAYRGWQRQPGGIVTVQQNLEETLSEIHGLEVILSGCGRTDAGVHATQFYAGLSTKKALADNYVFVVNKRLPEGIALREVIPVSDKAQARFDATERTYDYYFHERPNAFLDRYSSLLDLASFAPAVSAQTLPLLLQYEDFRAFCKTPDRHNTTIVRFREVTLYRNAAGDRYRLRFVANRFLRGLIRLLINDLVMVGKGQLSASDFEDMLQTGERKPHFRLAPPEGLFLTGVRYPYIDREAVLPVSGRGEWVKI